MPAESVRLERKSTNYIKNEYLNNGMFEYTVKLESGTGCAVRGNFLMIGRNDPCHCGSGKKYKKCCGSTQTDLVGMIVNEELDRVLTGFFDNYPIGLEQEEMNILMREWSNRLTDSWEKEHVEEASSEFYLFIKNNKGWHSYIGQQLAQTKREVVRNVLKEWDEPVMLLAEITEAINRLYSSENIIRRFNLQNDA